MTSKEGNERDIKVENGQGDKRAHVKRPMNAFMLWSKEKRRKVSSVDPSLHNSHISKILGEEWKTLPSHEKDPFIKESKTLMEKHKLEHPDYHYKPRQNKLTKALKELSSLHTSLATPVGFASSVKSLSIPRYVPGRSCCTPYLGLERRRLGYEREEKCDDLPYHATPAYYAARSPCSSCTCKLGCFDRESCLPVDVYRWRARSSRMCYQDRPTRHERSWNLHSVPPIRYGWSVPVLINTGYESSDLRSQRESREELARSKDHNSVGSGERSELITLELSEKPEELMYLHSD